MAINCDEGEKAKKLIQSTLCVDVSKVSLPPVSMSTENTVEERNNDLKELREMSPVVIPEQEAEESVGLLQKKRVKCMDLERILMGEELCDIEINFSQNLLKAQFK